MRVVENSQHKIAYFPVPKIASTSLKHAFYNLEFNKPYVPGESAAKAGVHGDYAKTRHFFAINHARYKDYARIAVIRDPVHRLISAYQHRIYKERELDESRIDMALAEALGVHPNPTRRFFFRHIEQYRLLSASIRHHTEPITSFLGPDLGYFTDIYRIGKISQLAEQISVLTGQEFEIGFDQKGPERPKNLQMGRGERLAVLQYCAGDYALLKKYYSIPEPLRD